MSIMSQDIHAKIGLTTDYRREASSSNSGRITLKNDPHRSVLHFCKTTKVHPALCDMPIVLLSEISARSVLALVATFF